jgi:nucleoside-diphosphate-sugar epimerase
MRVLITGAFGWTAVSIIKALKQAGHDITAFDLPGAACSDEARTLFSEIVLGTVADFDDVQRATQSVDAIIHLAIAIGERDYQQPEVPFSVNVAGTYNVFENARRRGVRKIALISSAAVHLAHLDGERLQALADWKSSRHNDHLYDLTKRLQEEIARDFCDTFRMNTVVLRAGHIVDGRMGVDPAGRPLSTLDYCRGGWVCRHDLATACVKALELSAPGYSAFHVIGAIEALKHYDVERTQIELGLAFETRFEQYQ